MPILDRTTAKRGRKLYEELADEIARQIAGGLLRPGDRLPSIRQTSKARHLSSSTVFQAYLRLENRGLIRATPRSGWFVSASARLEAPETPVVAEGPHQFGVEDLVSEVLNSARSRGVVPLGSAFPTPLLFPLDDLRRALSSSTRKLDAWSTFDDLPLGNEELRRQIGKRYLMQGLQVSLDEIVLTNGCMDALTLCLATIARPGDAVVVGMPCFYAVLRMIERFGLKAIEVTVDPREGVDLAHLSRILKTQRPKACWLMTNFQNPLGCSLSREKKRALVALLSHHEVPLIEDDVFSELYHGSEPPASAKTFDREGSVMHCSSFSKSLAPGYRVGWVAAGRFAHEVRRLKLMTSVPGSIPAQAAVAEFLRQGGYDRHLRRLREALKRQKEAMVESLLRHFPAGTRLIQPDGGYFIWVDLPWEAEDALTLYRSALSRQVSIAPGPMFSSHGAYRNCLRLNFGYPWGSGTEIAIATLGQLVSRRSATAAEKEEL